MKCPKCKSKHDMAKGIIRKENPYKKDEYIEVKAYICNDCCELFENRDFYWIDELCIELGAEFTFYN
jgi:transposase-like protein